MSVVTKTFDVNSDELFDVISDPSTYPSWLVGTKHILAIDSTWPRPASEFEHEVGAGPLKVHDTTEVTNVVPGRALDLVAKARPFLEADVHFEIEDLGDQSTLSISETPRGFYRLFAFVIDPVVRKRNERSLERLERFLQGAPS